MVRYGCVFPLDHIAAFASPLGRLAAAILYQIGTSGSAMVFSMDFMANKLLIITHEAKKNTVARTSQ